MPARYDSAAYDGAGVGKPPGNERARYGSQSDRRCYGGPSAGGVSDELDIDVRPSRLSRGNSFVASTITVRDDPRWPSSV
jgi:hypothetical protein